MIDILMPRLSDTMTEGAISVWHKKPGDHVDVGDILVEVESDKAVMEQEAYEEGTLVEILVPEGENVAIGTPIARLDDGSPDPAPTERQPAATQGDSEAGGNCADTATDGRDETAAKPASEPAPSAAAPLQVDTEDRLFASPIVRRLARERAVDLRKVTGTGPGGRIVRADLDATVAATPAAEVAVPQAETVAGASTPSDSADEVIPFDRIRQAIATRLTESGTRVPTFNVTASANVGALLELRARINSDRAADTPKVSLNDLLIRASAIALRAHPLVNASYSNAGEGEGGTVKHGHVNVGFAVASPAGLVVPVVRDADRATVTSIAAVTRNRIDKASERKLTAAEMSGGTFTVSNLGMYGVEHFTAIINPPEGAILAVGAGYDELVLAEGEVQPQHRLRYTLTADHRIIDGALAAQFLATFTELLEHPMRIVT